MLPSEMSRITGRLRGWCSFVVCFALLTCFSASSRATVTNLTNGGSINFSSVVGSNPLSVQVGDKLFSNFSFQYTDTDMNNGNDLGPSALVLSALSNQLGFGIGIQLPLIATGSTIKDIVLRFSTTVLDPNELISGVDLDFTSAVSGHGIASVAESIFTNGFGAGLIDTLKVQNPGTPTVYEDSAFFAVPQHEIWIEKDISVDANGICSSTDWASISLIDQTISQIPEPSTIALSVIGLVTCLFVKRRR